MDSSIEMRLAGPDDLGDIGSLLPDVGGPLFSERFPEKTVADFCRWKYFDNPLGDSAVGVAVADGRVVSVVAGTPKWVEVNARRVLAFELGDFITDTQYRKKGLFSSLVQLVCNEAGKRGAAFAYVRPNEVSFPILMKGLSFVEARKIDERSYIVPSGLIHRKTGLPAKMGRLLGVDAIVKLWALRSRDSSVSVRPTPTFGNDVDEFWKRARRGYSFTLERNSKYLTWRYVKCTTPYQSWIASRGDCIAGYIVIFVSPAAGIGYVVDLFTEHGDAGAAAALVSTAFDVMLAAGAQSVHSWTLQASASSGSSQVLRRSCPLTYKQHLRLAMRFLDSEFTVADLPSTGWQLAAGDFDGV